MIVYPSKKIAFPISPSVLNGHHRKPISPVVMVEVKPNGASHITLAATIR
jgi:hypothetical protein